MSGRQNPAVPAGDDLDETRYPPAGKIWCIGHPEPVIVSVKASDLARLASQWRFVEVSNVYP